MNFLMKASTPVLLALTITLQPFAQAQSLQDDDVVRVSTNLVTVPVAVKTSQGAYVPNLKPSDFRVYEDGQEQKISQFDSVDQPFTIVLMLDVSDSTRAKLTEIQNAAVAFLRQLRSDDRALIVVFDKQIVKLTSATSDQAVLAAAIRRARAGGGTALYDAVDTVISSYLAQVPGRKAVVLLTDGIDTSSVRANYDGSLNLAAAQYSLIYPIQWNTPEALLAKQTSRADNLGVVGSVVYTTPNGESLSKAYERGTRYLQAIARNSGGRFHQAAKVQDLERSFALIAEELRQLYSLSYSPINQDVTKRKRQIKVTVNLSDIVVRARANYLFVPHSR